VAKGFKFVTVSELIAMDRPLPPKPKATPSAKPATADSAKTPVTAPTGKAAPATPAAAPKP